LLIHATLLVLQFRFIARGVGVKPACSPLVRQFQLNFCPKKGERMKKKIVIGLFALALFANVSGAGIITIVPNSHYGTGTSSPTTVSSATVTTTSTSSATSDSTTWFGRLMSMFSLWL